MLAVAPGNKQVNRLKAQYGVSATTVCKFVGERVCEEDTKETGREVVIDGKRLNDFKVIVLDEFFQNPIKECSKILRVCSSLGARIICNGDVFQNNNGETCTVSRKEYFNAVLPRFFPMRLTLRESRRLKLEEDRVKAYAMRKDLEAGVSIRECVARYGLNTVNDMEAVGRIVRKHNIQMNITLENATACVINQMYAKCVRAGDTVVCKKYIKGLVRNEIYKIEAVNDTTFTIGGKEYKKSGFRLPFAYTCHAVQGEDVDGCFIIYDIDHFGASYEWFYTAATRATYLKNVFVYTGPSLAGAIDWGKKLQGYIEQDKKAGRATDITLSYMKELCSKANYCCCHCQGMVAMVYEEGDDDQWTLDRIDDAKGHVVGNLQLAHLRCNRALGFMGKQ